MNKNNLTIHLFCLLLFVGGCGLFWMFGEDDEKSENIVKVEKNQYQTNDIKNNLLNNKTKEDDRGISNNISSTKKNTKGPSFSSSTSEKTDSRKIGKNIATMAKTAMIQKNQNSVAVETNNNYTSDDLSKTVSANNTCASKEQTINNSFRKNKSIKAVIYGEHKNIGSGSHVRLRILENISLNGIDIPKNTVVFANANCKEDRVYLTVESVTYQKKNIPINATIYDINEIEGITTSTTPQKKGGKLMLPPEYRVIMKIN